MKFENFSNRINEKLRKARQFIAENDIHKTIPESIAKNIVKIDAIPNQIGFEVSHYSKTILEKYNAMKRESFSRTPAKLLSDHEIKNITQTIKDVRKLPIDKRAQKMADIKETLAWMKFETGIGMNNAIRGLIDNPPDSKEATFELVKSKLDRVPISWEDYGAIMTLTDNFFERYQNVIAERNKCTDQEIFMHACGVMPEGDIEVFTTPIGFYFRTHNLIDYANLYFWNKSQDPDWTGTITDAREANKSGGVKTGGFIAENSGGRIFLGRQRTVYEHELQHLVYEQLNVESGDMMASGDFNKDAIKFWLQRKKTGNEIHDNEVNRDHADKIIEKLFTKRMDYMLSRAKDELLAYTIDREKSEKDIFAIMTQTSDEGGLYDYYERNKYWLYDMPYVSSFDLWDEIPIEIQEKAKELRESGDYDASYSLKSDWLDREVGNIQDYFRKLMPDVGEKVYIMKYRKTLREGLRAMARLKNSGIESDVAVRILTYEPLQKWPKVVARLLGIAAPDKM